MERHYYRLKPKDERTSHEIVLLTEGKILSVWAGDYSFERISKEEAFKSVTAYQTRANARDFPR